MFLEFISSQDAIWTQLLQRASHDVYHLPEYVSFAARQEGGRAGAFVARSGDDALLIPLITRALPPALNVKGDYCDVLTPYGYAGPVVIGQPSDETLARMFDGFLQLGRERGIVSAFLRLHPLLPFPMEPLRSIGALVSHGRTVYMDLSLTPEEMWAQTHQSHRRHIRKLQNNGFVAVRDQWEHWPAFADAYRKTMQRVGAGGFYFFSDDYFEDLKASLGDKLAFWAVLSPDGKLAGAAVLTAVNGIVQYHLGGTADEFVQWSPNKLLFSEARLWAKEQGFRLFHLGGGVGGAQDSLYTFKSRFAPLSTEFHTLRIVVMPSVYADLIPEVTGDFGLPRNDEEQFFPAYRKTA